MHFEELDKGDLLAHACQGKAESVRDLRRVDLALVQGAVEDVIFKVGKNPANDPKRGSPADTGAGRGYDIQLCLGEKALESALLRFTQDAVTVHYVLQYVLRARQTAMGL